MIGHDLRIKYGLTEDPSDSSVARWADRVRALIAEGTDLEQAGRAAALEIFGELEAIFYFSEADTIESLLALARTK